MPDTSHCLARSVVSALVEDPTLEAVTIDRARKRISVATLGNTDVPRLTERISGTLERAQQTRAKRRCTLLAGHGQCATCTMPLSDAERRRISICHEGEKTTISRVTCPTAPKFWRWRDLPWPRVVQRDVEFLEHADEPEEWKAQLLAAVLCGLFGLAAWFLKGSAYAVPIYALAYLAGGWHTAQEV